ncbi:MAG: hypothetical protein KIT40_04810 [Nitrospira sp.]|nr:hypothetical protein [Nitrospira sp.]
MARTFRGKPGQKKRSGALPQMGSPTTSQTAVRIVADQEKEEVQQPLTA